jgi:uncharacterized repeat protein (TIGR02543 family)
MKRIVKIGVVFLSLLTSSSLLASSTTFLSLAENYTTMNSTDFGNNYNRLIIGGPDSNGIRILNTTGGLSRYIGYKPQLNSGDDSGFSTYFQFQVSSTAADGFVLVFSEGVINGAGPAGGAKGYPPSFASGSQSFGINFMWWSGQRVYFRQNGGVRQNEVRTSLQSNGLIHIWVDYEFTPSGGNLKVYHLNTATNVPTPQRPATHTLTRAVSETFTKNGLHVGVTAATGGSTMNAWLRNMYYSNTHIPTSIDVTQTITVDNTPPTILVTPSVVSITEVSIDVSSSDLQSGLSNLTFKRPSETSFSSVGGSSGQFNVTESGLVQFQAVDNAGNFRNTNVNIHTFNYYDRSTLLETFNNFQSLAISGSNFNVEDYGHYILGERVVFEGRTYEFGGYYSDPYFNVPLASTSVAITNQNINVYSKFTHVNITQSALQETSENTISLQTPSLVGYTVLEWNVENGTFEYTFNQTKTSILRNISSPGFEVYITSGAIFDKDDRAIPSTRAFIKSNTNKTWYAASDFCADNGGYLATITSQDEWDFIRAKFPNTNVWLGGTDTSSEGNWQWLNNEGDIPGPGTGAPESQYPNGLIPGFQKWNDNEPNDFGSGEDYLEMTSSGLWNDLPSTSNKTALCEFQHLYTTLSAINVTETSIVNHHSLVLVFNNGQSNVTFDVGYGAAFSLLPVPQRDGFQFDGWYFENTFVTPATGQNKTSSTQTLYAKWGPVQHPITYILGAGLTAADTYITETTKTLTVHTRAGFTFEGYYDNPTFTGNPITNLSSGNFGAKTYYAKFLPITYQINYVITNRAITTTIFLDDLLFETFTPEFDDFEIAIPYATGYTFKEWRLNTVTGAVVTEVQNGTTNNLNLIGIWDINHYSLEYDLLSGLRFNNDASLYTMSHPNPATYTIEDHLTFQNATVLGYQFTGWEDISGSAITNISIGQIGNVSLVATWVPIDYTLTFDAAGGNAINPLTAPFESDITLPFASRPGYRFDGWFENGVRVDYDLMPLNNRTLEAQWTALPYTLTFVNSITGEQTTLTANFNTPIQMPQIIEPGYTFGGWLENNRAVRFTTMPLGNRTLVASFNARNYTISFSAEIGSAPASIQAAYRSSVSLPTMNVEHYTFKGWQGPNGLIEGSMSVPIDGASLTAVFEPKLYTISFSGEGIELPPVELEFDAPISLPTPSRSGYRFTGWTLNGQPFNTSKMPGENITLVGAFEKTELVLRLVSEGRTIQETTLYHNDAFTLPTAQKRGHTFDGWYEGNNRIRNGAMPARNMTLEARFLINSYPVTFNDHDSTVTERFVYETLATLPSPERLGYRFTGWAANGQIIEQLLISDAVYELTAVYQPLVASMTFVTPLQQFEASLTTNQPLANLNPLNVPDGYSWVGYFTLPFGAGESIQAGRMIDNAHDTMMVPYYLRAGQVFESSSNRLSTEPYYYGNLDSPVSHPEAFPWFESITFITTSMALIGLYVASKGGKRDETI